MRLRATRLRKNLKQQQLLELQQRLQVEFHPQSGWWTCSLCISHACFRLLSGPYLFFMDGADMKLYIFKHIFGENQGTTNNDCSDGKEDTLDSSGYRVVFRRMSRIGPYQ
mmetsp:Transcript_40949/g.49696  ORF Transcript_40949/g.49696 Transcript_40949/m.49696 type:complete len:110 (-) Transcript_40949:234-563(-)